MSRCPVRIETAHNRAFYRAHETIVVAGIRMIVEDADPFDVGDHATINKGDVLVLHVECNCGIDAEQVVDPVHLHMVTPDKI